MRLTWITLGIGCLASVIAALQVRQGIEQAEVRQFAFNCDQVALKIQERLGAYALILRGGAALFAASTTVERNEWRAYVETLRASGSVSGVQGIGFAEVIPPEELASHLARIRGEGFPDYRVRPPGARTLYTSIIYLEPFRDRNLRAFGFDMYAEPVRRAAMNRARDSGDAALSGKVELVQETGTQIQAGTLLYVPVYRNGAPTDTLEQRRAALLGWAYSPYRMHDLMIGILGDGESHAGKTLDLTIYDGLDVSPAGLLFDSQPDRASAMHSPFYQQRTLDLHGRTWLLAFDRTASAPGIGNAPAWTTLAGGLALSGLLFGLILAVINTRKNAARIAGELADKIRRTAAAMAETRTLLLTVIDTVPIRVFWKDRNLCYLGCNTAFARDAGMTHPRDVIGKDDHQMSWAAQAELFRADDRSVMASGLPKLSYDEQQTTGQTTWFRTSKVALRDRDNAVFGLLGIYEDITDRKQAEEKVQLAANVFTHAWEGIMITAADGTIIDVNEAFTRITSYRREDVLGRNPRLLGSGR
ncbi:CHASE domain-containing protein, partial [uncultured Thiocystis sp.]|uniref:CHASE domain-containing protein n=1 Tax=uncultured Thiocystis sp. TaxID=1202134 RepID=UPI0025F9551C